MRGACIYQLGFLEIHSLHATCSFVLFQTEARVVPRRHLSYSINRKPHPYFEDEFYLSLYRGGLLH